MADLDLADIAARPELVIGGGPTGIIAIDPDERDALVAAVRWAQDLVAVFSDSRALNSDEVDAALNGLDEALKPFGGDR